MISTLLAPIRQKFRRHSRIDHRAVAHGRSTASGAIPDRLKQFLGTLASKWRIPLDDRSVEKMYSPAGRSYRSLSQAHLRDRAPSLRQLERQRAEPQHGVHRACTLLWSCPPPSSRLALPGNPVLGSGISYPLPSSCGLSHRFGG